MPDLTEIEALKASLRGARRASDALADIAIRIDMADPRTEVSEDDLDELRRLTLANAVAAQALRGLTESMLKRRGKIQAMATDGAAGDVED